MNGIEYSDLIREKGCPLGKSGCSEDIPKIDASGRGQSTKRLPRTRRTKMKFAYCFPAKSSNGFARLAIRSEAQRENSSSSWVAPWTLPSANTPRKNFNSLLISFATSLQCCHQAARLLTQTVWLGNTPV